MTTTDSWLPLAEYSMKHHVSVSTLRRRIKAEDIQYRFSDGKYLILDDAAKNRAQAEEHRPSLSRDVNKVSAQALMNVKSSISGMSERIMSLSAPAEMAPPASVIGNEKINEAGESVITAANKLLIDLKKAYTQVLHEKEEQIMHLKEENIDLKTLIKVLESENTRLRDRLNS